VKPQRRQKSVFICRVELFLKTFNFFSFKYSTLLPVLFRESETLRLAAAGANGGGVSLMFSAEKRYRKFYLKWFIV
jgi:hypothetical protein